MRAFDWARPRIGRPDGWPRALKTAVRIMLTSRQPIWLGWGPRAHLPLQRPVQVDHRRQAPARARQALREVWREIWDQIGPMVDAVMKRDEGTYVEAQLLIMERNGYPGGDLLHLLLQPGARRRRRHRRPDLRQHRRHAARDRRAPARAAARARRAHRRRAHVAGGLHAQRAGAGTNPQDLPFALLYVEGRRGAALVAGIGRDGAMPRWPPAGPREPRRWRRRLVGRVGPDLGELPTGAWHRAPREPRCSRSPPPASRPRRRARGRAESVPAVRRRLPRLPRRWSRGRSPRASPTPRPTSRSASAPRRSPSSTGPRPRSSATSATSSARRSR